MSFEKIKGTRTVFLLFLNRVRHHYEITIIFIAGLILRLYMAQVDPLLNDWDERFHAVVARHMMQHPFRPMLIINPVVPYNPDSWCCNSVWLHKQPLFMWQIAACMKVFGVSEFTLRLPSVIMGSLMILLVYRITLLVTSNKRTAWMAGLLMCFSHYTLELTSGRFGMDHNDVAFCFYILASVWAYFEYLNKPLKRWIILIGIFAGCAILNKWLTGLLVFAPWGLKAVYDFFESKNRKQIGHIALSILICCIVFLPWQIYIFHAFPEEARYEMAYNAKHITEAVENHGGDNWFYWHRFSDYFGEYICYLLLPGILLLWAKKSIPKKYAFALTLLMALVFCFFTFFVKTRILSFVFTIAPYGLVLIAIALASFFHLFRKKKWLLVPVMVVALGITAYLSLNPLEMIEGRKIHGNWRVAKTYNTTIYKGLQERIPANINVVINCNGMEHTDVMFYNGRLTAYHYYFSKEEMDSLARQKVPIAAFEERVNYQLPDYVKSYPYLFIIHEQLR